MVTHGIGAVLAVLGLVALLGLALVGDDIRVTISLTIYGATLVLLYLASTLYHAIRHKPTKLIFKTCDHAAIFLLIAGTYTPYCLLVLGGAWGWTLFAVVWSIAAFGVVFKIFHTNRYARLSLMLYLAHRLGRSAGRRADHREHGNDRAAAAGAGRAGLYRRRRLLRVGEHAVQPCGLASLRAGGQHLSFPVDLLLCRSRGVLGLTLSGCGRN